MKRGNTDGKDAKPNEEGASPTLARADSARFSPNGVAHSSFVKFEELAESDLAKLTPRQLDQVKAAGGMLRISVQPPEGYVEVPFAQVRTRCDLRKIDSPLLLRVSESGELFGAEWVDASVSARIPAALYDCRFALENQRRIPFVTVFQPALHLNAGGS